MAKAWSPWRALRPFLLAGAVTATWLTLSATAATADSSRDSASLLGGVTSSASSLPAPETRALAPVLETASPAPTGLLQPVVGSAAGSADQLIAAVPVVKSLLPAGTVTAMAVPVAAVVDTAADDLVEAAVPPLTEPPLTDSVPVLEPVLKPVVDLVEKPAADLVDAPVPSSPVTLPGLLPLDESAVAGEIPTVADAPAAATAAAAEHITANATADSPGTSGNLLSVTGRSSLPVAVSTEMHAVPAENPWTADPSTPPAPAPAGPAVAGSGASPSGPSGSFACLDEFGFNLALPGSLPVSGSPERAPSPVSFDPGSSPD